MFSDVEVEELRSGVDDVISAAAGSRFDMNHTWSAARNGDDELQELVLKGFHDLQYHAAVFTRAVAHPHLVGALTQVIGPNVQLHHTKMLVKPLEKGAPFPMRQDYPYFPHTRHSLTAASVHFDDATEENGCLRVVPGSHKLGPLEAIGPRHVVDGENHVNWGQGLMVAGENQCGSSAAPATTCTGPSARRSNATSRVRRASSGTARATPPAAGTPARAGREPRTTARAGTGRG